MTEDQITQQMAAEIVAKQTPMELGLRPQSVLMLASLVQLATRHPHCPDSHLDMAETFLAAVRDYFADCPVTLDVLRRGDDPTQDVSIQPPDRSQP